MQDEDVRGIYVTDEGDSGWVVFCDATDECDFREAMLSRDGAFLWAREHAQKHLPPILSESGA